MTSKENYGEIQVHSKRVQMNKEKKRRKISCSTILIVFTGLCIALILVRMDFRHVPDDLRVYSSINRDDVEVTGIIWYEVRPKDIFEIFYSRPYVSFEAIIENKGKEILEIRDVRSVIRDEDDVEKWSNPYRYGGRSFPYIVLYPGESRPLWLWSKTFPKLFKRIDWKEVEIQIKAWPVREFLECQIVHVYDIEINEIGFDEEGLYVIDGKVGEALKSDDIMLPAAYFSFYDENGNFIGGRGMQYPARTRGIYDRWDPYNQPSYHYPSQFYEGGFFQGEVASYKFHFAETDSEYYYCP